MAKNLKSRPRGKLPLALASVALALLTAGILVSRRTPVSSALFARHDSVLLVGTLLAFLIAAATGIIARRGSRARVRAEVRFERIREQAQRAASLTRELLAFARKQVLQPQAVDINQMVAGLLSFIEKVMPKNVILKVINGPLEPVKADLTQMDQVLMNLCLNARDACPTVVA
jgi:signal transduction histidine kinase